MPCVVRYWEYDVRGKTQKLLKNICFSCIMMKIVIDLCVRCLGGMAAYEYKSYKIFSRPICIDGIDLYCDLFCSDGVCFDENEYSGE